MFVWLTPYFPRHLFLQREDEKDWDYVLRSHTISQKLQGMGIYLIIDAFSKTGELRIHTHKCISRRLIREAIREVSTVCRFFADKTV